MQLRPDVANRGDLLTEGKLETLMKQSTDWDRRVQLTTPSDHFKGKFMQLLTQGYPFLSPVFCGSNVGMYLFDAHGDVYICWDSVGEPIGKVGSYWPELSFAQTDLDQWHERTIMSIPECIACKYSLLCGGGCTQHAYYATGTLKSPYCYDFGGMFCASVPAAYKQYLSSLEQTVTNASKE